jgi:multidrug efflux pump subunit AcrA (membrane-fusion protein)
VIAWFRRIRWPLRHPAIREARDDYRDAQAAIRRQLEAERDAARAEAAELRSALATALIAQWMWKGSARRPDTDVTAVQPRPRRSR